MSELEKILNELERLAKQGIITIKEYDEHIETLEYGKLEELRLNNYSAKLLLNYIQQKESIIKEVREYIKNNDTTFKANEVVNAFGIPSIEFTIEPWKKDVLEILDKENNNEDN